MGANQKQARGRLRRDAESGNSDGSDDRLVLQTSAIFAGSHADITSEDVVELGNRTKPGSEHHFRDSPGGVSQQALCLFNTNTGDVFRQRHASGLLEELA